MVWLRRACCVRVPWSRRLTSSSDDGIHLGLPESARLAVGSFVEEQTNRIQVLGTATTEDGYVVPVPSTDVAMPL